MVPERIQVLERGHRDDHTMFSIEGEAIREEVPA
jgi:hypothetical protein